MKIWRGHIARDILHQILCDVGEVRVEVRIVGRDAHAVGADEAGGRFDLGLAALDGGPAVAAEVLARRQREIRRVGVAVLRVVPLDARQQPRHPRVLGLEEADAKLRMELEHAADDHRDQRLLHLDPVAGHVTVEAVLAVEVVHVRVVRAHVPRGSPTSRSSSSCIAVERIPVVRVPVVPVDEVRPDERADGAELAHARAPARGRPGARRASAASRRTSAARGCSGRTRGSSCCTPGRARARAADPCCRAR